MKPNLVIRCYKCGRIWQSLHIDSLIRKQKSGMGEFSFSNINEILRALRQQSNLYSRNDGCGPTLVLYPQVFINQDGNTFTEHSFNNKGNGNQDCSSADINSIVPAIRTKPSSPSPPIHTVSTNPNQYHSSSYAGISAYLYYFSIKIKVSFG